MLKFFKEYFANYDYAQFIQTASLVLFVLVFIGIIIRVYTKPKGYYDDMRNAPLNDNEDSTKIKAE